MRIEPRRNWRMDSHRRLVGASLALASAALACRLNLGGPDLPPAPVISEAAATEAAGSWSEALEGALTTGQVTLILTEEQLTSALAANVAADDESAFQSPVVLLRDGFIQVYGMMHQGPVEASMRLVVTPVVDGDGRLGFELTSADFGPLPASEGLRGAISGMLSEALSGPLGSLATGFRITSVAVADGELAIVAELR
jgi:hypothetical protein